MKVGSLVECVNDVFPIEHHEYIPNRPKKGQHYFIRHVRERNVIVGVLLEEISNPPVRFRNGTHEPTFKAERFREIDGLDEAVEELLEENIFATLD
jgi:hypothetical protein